MFPSALFGSMAARVLGDREDQRPGGESPGQLIKALYERDRLLVLSVTKNSCRHTAKLPPPSPTPHGCKFGRASSAGPSGPTTSSPDPPTSSELGAPLVPPASTNNQQPRGGWNGNGARQVFYPPRVTKPGVFATLQRPLTALDSTVEIERAQMESGGGRVEVLRAGRGDFMRRHGWPVNQIDSTDRIRYISREATN